MSYAATFELRIDDLALNALENNEIAHLVGRSDDGTAHFEVGLRRALLPAPGQNQLLLAAREDNGTVLETPSGEEIPLPDGYNTISIHWSAGPRVGQLLVSLNDAAFVGLMDLENGAARIDKVNWGIVGGEVSGASEHLDMDEFSSSR